MFAYASAMNLLSDSPKFGQDSLSDGRKIFRLFKEFREVYKVGSLRLRGNQRPLKPQVRRGWSRFSQGAQEEGCLDWLFHWLFDVLECGR